MEFQYVMLDVGFQIFLSGSIFLHFKTNFQRAYFT